MPYDNFTLETNSTKYENKACNIQGKYIFQLDYVRGLLRLIYQLTHYEVRFHLRFSICISEKKLRVKVKVFAYYVCHKIYLVDSMPTHTINQHLIQRKSYVYAIKFFLFCKKCIQCNSYAISCIIYFNKVFLAIAIALHFSLLTYFE